MAVPRRRDIDHLQQEVEELFADLWQVPRFSGLHRGYRPQIDCFQRDDPPELTVVVELPGVDPEQVEVVAGGSSLLVAGERRRPRPEGVVSYSRMEIDEGRFRRHVSLPADVDAARATATYERGILTIVLPIVRRRQRERRVEIEVTRQ